MHEMNTTIATMNLRTLDLNLLLVFEAVLHESSVIGAAKRLHLSQPATSHALNRLRRRLNDQLFVRTPAGMMPTPRAQQPDSGVDAACFSEPALMTTVLKELPFGDPCKRHR